MYRHPQKDRAQRRDAAAAKQGVDSRALLTRFDARGAPPSAPGKQASPGEAFSITGEASDDDGDKKRSPSHGQAAFDLVDSEDELEKTLTEHTKKYKPPAGSSGVDTADTVRSGGSSKV